MSTTVRLTRQDPYGTGTMLVAGEHGVVAASLSGRRIGTVILHSPREIPSWREGTKLCAWMEMPCWYLSSLYADELDQVLLEAYSAYPDEEQTWRLLEDNYRLYLAGER